MRARIYASLLILCGSTAALAALPRTSDRDPQERPANTTTNGSNAANDAAPANQAAAPANVTEPPPGNATTNTVEASGDDQPPK